ncbi:hypothetical protein HYH03_009185 [Edaphochlamys debaryana]|uniref:Peptidase M11 gametolysin domain-containing protein n=1 Tax=Edaphochlamys debaryana TaxID=47281 RepID=A0A836BXG6_9CHLO|nr:hypothetical protein HYH03_009185 [Edaphochlamys debaryana]|eukprot:KAG2492520.1 hypothetical protein HYH03_009185 [Edaphochlamys debaryana]
MRSMAGAAAALLVLLAVGAVQVADAQSTMFAGIQGVVISKSDDAWALRSAAGAVYRLHAQPRDASGALVDAGATVVLDLNCATPAGGDDWSWECGATGAATVALPAPAVATTGRTLALLTLVIAFNGTCTNPGANATLVDQAIERIGGYADNLKACSYGQMQVNKTTSKTVSVVLNCTAALLACDEDALAAAATAAAERRGVVVSAHTNLAFVLPAGLTAACNWTGGVAELPGRRSWFSPDAQGIFSRGTHMQKLLNNFGLYSAWRNGVEGDDASSSQGKGFACPSAPELWRLRWAQPGAVLAAAGLPVGVWKGAYELSVTYVTSRNMIKIVPDWLGTAYTQNLYFALRGKGGGDRDLLNDFDRKVSYHTVSKDLDQQLGTAEGDPRVTLVGRLFPGTTSLLSTYRLVVAVGALTGEVKVSVLVCRYALSPSEW